MVQTKGKRAARGRRRFTEEFKREAVQMLLDGHSAGSVAERLGLSGPNLLYRWRQLPVDRKAGREKSPLLVTAEPRITTLIRMLRYPERLFRSKGHPTVRANDSASQRARCRG